MDQSARLTAMEIGWLLKVPTTAIRNWRYKGWLDSDGNRRYLDVNADGYLLGDVKAAEQDTRTSGQSRRRNAPPEHPYHVERQTRERTAA